MKTVVTYPLSQSIVFWICVGLFLYFTGNFFFLLFVDTKSDPNFAIQLKTIYAIVTITKDLLLSLAFFASNPVENENQNIQFPSELRLDDFTLTDLKNNRS
ncbi:MAG: hypothetical protein ABIN36_19810 [Ferruginibacter sp.]